MKTVTIDGIGTATYTDREWRNLRRAIDNARTDFHRREALAVARLVHEAKVAFGDDGIELTWLGPDDDRPLPNEQGEQLAIGDMGR